MTEFSVVVPVKNGRRWLAALLRGLEEQGEPLELLVIDSGSEDGSIDLARAAGARVLEIAPEEFGHGRTRNLGGEETTGDFICFLTQDATPLPGWLRAYREAFALDPRVGAAYGPHLPHPDTSPMVARELTDFFRGFSPDGAPVIHRRGDVTFLSNVNACYRRECWADVRFEDIAYAEDQAFGRTMLERGWLKVYHPEAAVRHAHDYGLREFARRYFDEYRGLRESVGHVESFGLRAATRDVASLVRADRRWMREQGWDARQRAAWTGRAAAHHGARKVFSALGSRAHALPARVQRSISLEKRASVAPPAAPPPAGPPASNPIPALRDRHVWDDILAVARDGVVPLAPSWPEDAERTPLHVAVVIPPFRRGSGGHNTIFELVTRLERSGHTCSIWVHDPLSFHRDEWAGKLRGDICEFFPAPRGPVFKGFDDWWGADVVVATSWYTVFPVLRLPRVRARAYLVQDHEPEFMPTSAERTWAEETYQHGLHCISASPWLRDVIAERYGAAGTAFELGVDHDVYRPQPVERRRDTVIFYAREVTPRRAVALGTLALDELRRRRPDLRFVLFGDPHPNETPFPYEHLGVASPEQLAWAYSEATVGLCLSMTNYSLIPQEMLACGLPCVDLAGACAEVVFGRDGPVELAPFDPVALADAIERLLADGERWERRSRAGLAFVADQNWDRAAAQVEGGLREALAAAARAAAPSEPAGAARPG